MQLTQDGVPVLLHDADILRTTGFDANVHGMNYSELDKLAASYASRFGAKFNEERIPSLVEFVELVKSWPDRKAFIEIKRSSIREFGLNTVLQNILPVIECIKEQAIVISFDYEVIQKLIADGQWKVGWVVDEWVPALIEQVEQLKPDYFFVDYECLPESLDQFPSASWEWVVYEIDDPILASKFVQKGASLIETNNIEKLLQSKLFIKSGCNDIPAL